MTSFCIAMNDLPSALKSKLPSTDSRFRPDLRALELASNVEVEFQQK